MKSRLLSNGLSKRTNRCLALADISITKPTIIRAFKSGKLYPFRWPPNYGKFNHFEVCDWAGIDWQTLRPEPPREVDGVIFPNIGISHRAWRCLLRSGIPTTKAAARHALRTGMLVPGKHPSNYGPRTHAELCRWTGIHPASVLIAKEKKRA
jgi:hypothetical protein